MVKKLLKFLAYTLFFLFALLVFMPKESFYFLAENELKKFEVVISNETLQQNYLSLGIQNLDISAKGVESALVHNAEILIMLFYNKLKFEDIELSSLVDAYLPANIEILEVSYSVLNPLEVTAFARGDFGEARASFSLLEQTLTSFVTPSQKMLKEYQKTMRMLKKDENGEYVYAKTF